MNFSTCKVYQQNDVDVVNAFGVPQVNVCDTLIQPINLRIVIRTTVNSANRYQKDTETH